MQPVQRQIYNLTIKTGAKVSYTKTHWSECEVDLASKEIFCCSLKSIKDYWAVLHEFGHLVLGHSMPSSWDQEVKFEIDAWEFVYRESLYPVSKRFKAEVEKFRIKGSWEKKTCL